MSGVMVMQKLQNCRIAESETLKPKVEKSEGSTHGRVGMADAPSAAMDKVAEDLKERTRQFAIKVLEFVETLPPTPANGAIARQLAKAGLGVVGNYRSSCRARSHTEFTARLGIVLEEADESELWLDVANAKNWAISVAPRLASPGSRRAPSNLLEGVFDGSRQRTCKMSPSFPPQLPSYFLTSLLPFCNSAIWQFCNC